MADRDDWTPVFGPLSNWTVPDLESSTTAATEDEFQAVNDFARTDEDPLVLIDLTANDAVLSTATITIVGINGVDVSPGDSVKFADGGFVTVRGDGVVAFDPNGAYEALNGGQRAFESFEYTISDGVNTSTATARVLIGGVNDGPTARNDRARTDEDSLVLIDLTENDLGVDTGTLTVTNAVTISAIGTVTITPGNTVQLDSGALVTLRGDGVVAFDPNGAFEDLDAGERAIERFRYTISDGENSSTATANVLITGVDDGPEANDDFARTDEDTLVLIDLTENDFLGSGNTATNQATVSITSIDGMTFDAGRTVELDSGGLVRFLGDGVVALSLIHI